MEESAGTTAPAPSGEAVTVHWWTGWSSTVLEEVAAAFNEQEPGIIVEWLGNVDQEKFLTSAAGGTPPDGALGAYPELFSRSGDVTEWINNSQVFDPDDVFEASWNGPKSKAGVQPAGRRGLCAMVCATTWGRLRKLA